MNIIINEDGQAEVYTPYNKEFIERLKKSIGSARWNPGKNCWSVPERSADLVRDIMRSVYGETDNEPGEHVDVKVTFGRDDWAECKPYVLFAKTIATAYGRDSGAKVGEGVELITGEFTSGGSRNKWKTMVEEGTVIIIRDVCKTLVDAWDNEDITVEIIGEAAKDKKELLKEKELLLNRLKEIDRLLGINE